MATINDLKEWLTEISRFGQNATHIEVVEPLPEAPSERRYKVRIYTDINCYSIHANESEPPSDAVLDPNEETVERMDKGYLGCISNCRKPRAGEEHHRGSDLADGDLTKETWHRILADIVSYEMVKIHVQPPQRSIPDQE